jgi:hypothetical protein
MPDNLARFRRLASQAATRRALARDEELTPAERWIRDIAADEWWSHKRPEYLAGPPHGCTVCYSWTRHKLGGWSWQHGAAVDPEERPFDLWDDGEPEPCEFCTHECHGPDGEPLPLIALAAC